MRYCFRLGAGDATHKELHSRQVEVDRDEGYLLGETVAPVSDVLLRRLCRINFGADFKNSYARPT